MGQEAYDKARRSLERYNTSFKEGYTWPLIGAYPEVPEPPHKGAFGVQRRFHVHEGIDLYAPEGTRVTPIEDGRVIWIEEFTGQFADPPSPWWNNTYAVYVRGKTGVFVYGEIDPYPYLAKATCSCQTHVTVSRGETIGTVMTAVRDAPAAPPLGWMPSMLHVELLPPGFIVTGHNTDKQLDPTNILKEARGYVKET